MTPRAEHSKKGGTKSKGAEAFQKLRIRVRAYEYKILDASVRQIMDTALRYDADHEISCHPPRFFLKGRAGAVGDAHPQAFDRFFEPHTEGDRIADESD